MTTTVEFPIEPQVKEFTARRWQLLIDGEWVKAKSEQTFQTHNPATGELLAECAQADGTSHCSWPPGSSVPPSPAATRSYSSRPSTLH